MSATAVSRLERTELPVPGQLVRVRGRSFLVEEVVPPARPSEQTLVRLSCLDDDAQGDGLAVLWEREVDAAISTGSGWTQVGRRGFDPTKLFSAYLHTLRGNGVTAADPRLMQASSLSTSPAPDSTESSSRPRAARSRLPTPFTS